jgi:hypothetical protein
MFKAYIKKIEQISVPSSGCLNLKILYSPAETMFLSMILMFLEKLQKTRRKSALGLSVKDSGMLPRQKRVVMKMESLK